MRDYEHNLAPTGSPPQGDDSAEAGNGNAAPRTMAMSPVARRVFLAAGLLALVQFALVWAGSMGIPNETVLPRRSLGDLPKGLGSWMGKDVEVDARLAAADHACDSVHRIYRNPAGEQVLVYGAVFPDVNVRVTPHSPEACYTAAGYQIHDYRDFSISSNGKGAFSARLLRLDREGQMGHVLFWFQVPETTYLDCYDQRKVFYAYRGKHAKPAVVKVMLQTSGPNAGRNAELLKDLAPHIHAWIEQAQETP